MAELFKEKCPFCNDQLKINDDFISGCYQKDDNENILSINELSGEKLFSVNIYNNKIYFLDLEVKRRLQVFLLELQCIKHNYRRTYSCYLSKRKDLIKEISLDEESVFFSNLEKTYWVRNLFTENADPVGIISSWDNKDDNPPKSQFDLDVMDDVFATLKLETKWLKISPSMENFQEKIENLITFG
jgi:hypothetical protein